MFLHVLAVSARVLNCLVIVSGCLSLCVCLSLFALRWKHQLYLRMELNVTHWFLSFWSVLNPKDSTFGFEGEAGLIDCDLDQHNFYFSQSP